MSHRIEIIAIAVSVLIAAAIFELIRKGKLQERYSLLWFGATVILIVLSLWRELLERIAGMLGVFYAPSALFLIAAFFGMLLALHFTIVVSRLSEQNKKLAQEIGLLGQKFQELQSDLHERK